MRNRTLVPMLSIFLLSGCIVAGRRGGGLEVIPILPAIVEVDSDNYYSHAGYHYFYTDNRWYYANSRHGQRSELPRTHWPRETHPHGRDHR